MSINSLIRFSHSHHQLVVSACDAPLDVLAFSGEESLSSPFSYRIEFTSADHGISRGQMLMKAASVTLHVDGAVTPLYRLFMRYGKNTAWSGMPADALAGPVHLLDEELFFSLITGLLP